MFRVSSHLVYIKCNTGGDAFYNYLKKDNISAYAKILFRIIAGLHSL